MPIRFDIITLFPGIFRGYLEESLLGKAQQRGLVEVFLHNLRDWSHDKKHHKVDDRPYGGGPGMVIRVEPVVECVEAVQQMADPPGKVIALVPAGKRLTQPLVRQLASQPRLILLCGRYEGFDQRVFDILQPEEISIGDYVLNGGEVAAMVIIDAVIRWIPGVLGDEHSPLDDSFAADLQQVEAAQYTRPREYRGWRVPEVLLTGNHQEIARWRKEDSLRRSQRRTASGNGDPRDCDPSVLD
jgi:tRNA (guanine37-N1)-methyltransferase